MNCQYLLTWEESNEGKIYSCLRKRKMEMRIMLDIIFKSQKENNLHTLNYSYVTIKMPCDPLLLFRPTSSIRLQLIEFGLVISSYSDWKILNTLINFLSTPQKRPILLGVCNYNLLTNLSFIFIIFSSSSHFPVLYFFFKSFSN